MERKDRVVMLSRQRQSVHTRFNQTGNDFSKNDFHLDLNRNQVTYFVVWRRIAQVLGEK